jgi:hypothetical protein
MKKVLTFLFGLAHRLTGGYEPIHNDALRANQGDRGPRFSFWRALVS